MRSVIMKILCLVLLFLPTLGFSFEKPRESIKSITINGKVRWVKSRVISNKKYYLAPKRKLAEKKKFIPKKVVTKVEEKVPEVVVLEPPKPVEQKPIDKKEEKRFISDNFARVQGSYYVSNFESVESSSSAKGDFFSSEAYDLLGEWFVGFGDRLWLSLRGEVSHLDYSLRSPVFTRAINGGVLVQRGNWHLNPFVGMKQNLVFLTEEIQKVNAKYYGANIEYNWGRFHMPHFVTFFEGALISSESAQDYQLDSGRYSKLGAKVVRDDISVGVYWKKEQIDTSFSTQEKTDFGLFTGFEF